MNEVIDGVAKVMTEYETIRDHDVSKTLERIDSETGLLNFDWLSYQGVPVAALNQMARDIQPIDGLSDWALELKPVQIYEVRASYSGEELLMNLSEWDLKYILAESQEIKVTSAQPVVLGYKAVPNPDFAIKQNSVTQISAFLNELGRFYQSLNHLFSDSEKVVELEYSGLLENTAELRRLYSNASRQELELINESILISSGILGSSIDRQNCFEFSKQVENNDFVVPDSSLWNRYVAIRNRRTELLSANRQLTELLENADGTVQALVYLCESLQRKTGIFDLTCVPNGATLGQRFESVKDTYLKLEVIYNLQAAQELENRSRMLWNFDKLLVIQTSFLDSLKDFLDTSFVLETQRNLDRLNSDSESASWSELVELIQELDLLDQEIKLEFWSENLDKAEKIRKELAENLILVSSLGLPVEQHGTWIFSRIRIHDSNIQNVIFLLRDGKKELESLKASVSGFEYQYSSNFPSKLVCSPELPVMGEEFDVFCSLLINYSFPYRLDGQSQINLKYPPESQLSSRNFVSGNLSLLESASSQNSLLKIRLRDVDSPQVFELVYRSELPAANISLLKESATSEFYTARYSLFSDCGFENALALIENPLGGLPANFSLPSHYEGSNAYVLISCGQQNLLNISGDPIELRKSKVEGGVLIQAINHLNHPLEVLFVQPYTQGASVNVSYSISDNQMLWKSNVSSTAAFFVKSGFLDEPRCGRDFLVDGDCCKLNEFDSQLLIQYNQLYQKIKQSGLKVPNPCELGLYEAVKQMVIVSESKENRTRPIPEALLFEKMVETSQDIEASPEMAEQLMTLLETRFGPELGNVDRNILDAVLEIYPYTPRPILVESRTPKAFSEIQTAFDSAEYVKVLEIYFKNQQELDVSQAQREFYLDKCGKYRELALQELEKARQTVPTFSSDGQRLVEMAEDAFLNKDFISSLYYSRYAILENPIGLEVQYRVPLAIGVILVGFYLYRTRSQKQEELI